MTDQELSTVVVAATAAQKEKEEDNKKEKKQQQPPPPPSFKRWVVENEPLAKEYRLAMHALAMLKETNKDKMALQILKQVFPVLVFDSEEDWFPCYPKWIEDKQKTLLMTTNNKSSYQTSFAHVHCGIKPSPLVANDIPIYYNVARSYDSLDHYYIQTFLYFGADEAGYHNHECKCSNSFFPLLKKPCPKRRGGLFTCLQIRFNILTGQIHYLATFLHRYHKLSYNAYDVTYLNDYQYDHDIDPESKRICLYLSKHAHEDYLAHEIPKVQQHQPTMKCDKKGVKWIPSLFVPIGINHHLEQYYTIQENHPLGSILHPIEYC